MMLGLTACGFMTAAAQPPLSDADRARASDLFNTGSRLYDEGAYEASIASFQQALDLTGRAELHFNLANCYERLGELQQAYNELNLYRGIAPEAERVTIDRRLAAIRERIDHQAALPRPAPMPVPVPVPSGDGRRTPHVETNAETWTLIGSGGALGLGSLVSVGFSGAAVHRQKGPAGTDGQMIGARVWQVASWVGVFGGAGLAIGGVLASDVTMVAGTSPAGTETVGLSVHF
jgi:hypothetical protein